MNDAKNANIRTNMESARPEWTGEPAIQELSVKNERSTW